MVPVLTYGSETGILREKESRIRAVQMNYFRVLLDIRRMDKEQNVRIKQLCGVTKGVDEKIDEGVLRWFDHMERMEKVYVGECASSRSVRSWKRWINTVKYYLKNRSLEVRQARRNVHDTGVWWGFARGNAWGVARG